MRIIVRYHLPVNLSPSLVPKWGDPGNEAVLCTDLRRGGGSVWLGGSIEMETNSPQVPCKVQGLGG